MVGGAALAVADNLVLERSGAVFPLFKSLVFETVELVPDGEGAAFLDGLVQGISPQAGDIRLESESVQAVAFVWVFGGNPPGNLETGVDELDLVFRALQDGLVSDLDEFVDIAEARGCLGSGDGVTDSVAVDPGALALEVRDQVFIEAVGSEDTAF